jgi:glycosyltransferase involved in cell wall biosynthesis
MVSIILCTYNRAALLPNAIRSVLHQSVREWELIVIDDGSNDNTKAIVREFQSKDNRILYHFQTNKGLAKARNAGLRRATGEFLCFVDSDDALAPDHIKRRLLFLERNPRIDFLHGGMKLIGPAAKQYVVDLRDTSKKIHLSKCHIGGTFFFRRKVLRFVRTFRPIPFGEDFDFYQRAAVRFKISKVAFPTYLYHLDSENRLCDIFTGKLLKQ